MAIPTFTQATLESICGVLGNTARGFTGSEIGRLLNIAGINDITPQNTKRHRIFEALNARQREDGCGNNVVHFIQVAMDPARHHDSEDWFEETRAKLNGVLIYSGLRLSTAGKLQTIEKASTHSEAKARAEELREKLIHRNVHQDVLEFCRAELLVNNYFHAVFEATKSVAEKIRLKTGLSTDGASLVDEAFAFKSVIPHLALNSLQSESEQSEQKGFANLLKGLFGTFRNTTAHAPKITWPINEQDALDVLALLSLVHRRLDSATCARKLYSGKI